MKSQQTANIFYVINESHILAHNKYWSQKVTPGLKFQGELHHTQNSMLHNIASLILVVHTRSCVLWMLM